MLMQNKSVNQKHFSFISGEAEEALLSVQTIHCRVMARTARCLCIVHNFLYISAIFCLKITKCRTEQVVAEL